MFFTLVVNKEEEQNNEVDFSRCGSLFKKILPLNNDEYVICYNRIHLFNDIEYCYFRGSRLIFTQHVIEHGDCITVCVNRRIEEINII